MNRKAPASVIKQLRAEVGFGCPVPECGNPYLEWHHFDPPWNVEPHHNPDGMVALCAEHHKKADNGAYTKEQLAALRTKVDPALVLGRFDWRRNKLLAVVGGNYYYETPRVLVIDGHEVVLLTRDEDGYLLLSRVGWVACCLQPNKGFIPAQYLHPTAKVQYPNRLAKYPA